MVEQGVVQRGTVSREALKRRVGSLERGVVGGEESEAEVALVQRIKEGDVTGRVWSTR